MSSVDKSRRNARASERGAMRSNERQTVRNTLKLEADRAFDPREQADENFDMLSVYDDAPATSRPSPRSPV